MNKLLLSLNLIAALFLLPESVFAVNPPQSLDPANGLTTTDTSPKLSWQYSEACPASGSCFLVEVDDSEAFDSPNKSTYTNNTYYTPQNLTESKWYWRVKGKDSSGSWSEWSSTNFIIATSTPSPSPSASASVSPSASASASSDSSGSTLSSAFVISSVPASVNSDQSFSVSIAVSLPSSSNTNFYIKGAFIKTGGSNYFGQTQVLGNWIKNSEAYTNQLSITTDSSGNWNGTLLVMPDSLDSGFSGSGSYVFKAGRYTSTGSGPTWSNEVSININAVITASATPTSTPKSTSSNSSSKASPTVLSASSASTSSKSIVSNKSLSQLPSIASVAGESSAPSATGQEIRKGERFINWWFIGAGGFVLLFTIGMIVKMFKTSYHTRQNDLKKQF